MAHDRVAQITFSQLGESTAQLRKLADRLDDFLAGDLTAWTAEEIAAAHQLVAFTGAQVNIARQLQATDDRRADVLPLDRHRRP